MAKNKSPKKKQPPPKLDERFGAMHLCTKCRVPTVHWRNMWAKLICSGCGKES